MPRVSYLRAGLSGCGERGAWVVEQVRRHGHCDVVALHDPDPRALQGLSEDTGIDRCATFDDLLHTGIDFVILASPPGAHGDQVEQAAAQGVHCLVQAPLCEQAAAASRLVAICEQAGVKLGVVVPEQGDPVLEEVRQLLAYDFIGGVVLVQSTSADDRLLRHPPGPRDWRRDPALTGEGALLQLAVPHVHLLSWLIGNMPLRVTAQASSGFTAMAEDAAVATVQLRGGVLCTFAASHLARGNQFAVHGTDGEIVLFEDRLVLRGRKQWHGELFDYQQPGELQIIGRSGLDQAAAAAVPAFELHGRFARWLDDTDDFPCTGEQAALDLRLLDAWRRSVLSGQVETV